MPAAVSVEEEIRFPGSMPNAWRCSALRVSRALNGDSLDVIREHDSRPCAEEHTTDSSVASKLERNIYDKVIDWIRWIRAC